MKRIATLLLLHCACMAAAAQFVPDIAVINSADVKTSINISSKTLLFIDSTASLTAEGVLQKPFFPLENFKKRRAIPPVMIPYGYFLKFIISNSADTPQSVFHYPGSLYDKIRLYSIGQQTHAIANTGENAGYKKMSLAPHQQITVLAFLKPIKSESVFINPQLIRSDFLDDYRLITLNTRAEIKTFGYVLSGVLLMMILFMLTNFVLNRRKEFLYNALYSLCMFLLMWLNSYVLRTTTRFTNFFMSYLDFFLLITGTIFYIAFTRKFLNTRLKYKLLDRMFKYGQVLLFLLMLVFTALNFFTDQYSIQSMLENVMKFMLLGIGIFFIALALRQNDRLLNYLAAGNAALVIFSAISLGIIWSQKKSVNLFTSSLFYYYIGIVLELIFFLLGLTYKNRKELIQRTREQATLKLYTEKKEFETQIAIMKAQQEERNRISADMHDDLGAGVTTIKLYSELAKNKLGKNSIPEIDKISASSDELLNKMNAIIWSMTSSNDSLGNMVAYIRSYALEYFEDSGIKCRISIPDNLPDIEVIGEVRRNVFLVVKEALNNILKHAKATEVNIILKKVSGGLTLTIHDNGIGINTGKLRLFGNGLKNMRKRMKDVGIEFSIENKDGTVITLSRMIEGF